jgi:hypothetical protein
MAECGKEILVLNLKKVKYFTKTLYLEAILI